MITIKTCLVAGLVGALLPILASGTIVQSNSSNNTSQSFFPCSTNDLVNGGQATALSNSPVASPQFGVPSALTNGILGGINDTSASGGVGSDGAWTDTLYLNTAVNTNGYTITNLDTFAGWANDRVTQQYELFLAYQGDPIPGTFYSYGTYTLNYNPGGGNCSTKIDLTDTTGVIASNVCAIRFAFTAVHTIYREVDAFGFPSTSAYIPPPLPNIYVSTNGSHTTPFDTWAKAATNIQAAIDLGLNKIVLVSNGTYDVTSPLSVTINTTVRSVNGATNTFVRRASGTTTVLTMNHANAVVDGFTFREGNSGAMTLTLGTLQNCIVASNTAGLGAIVMSGGVVKNSLLIGNSAGTYGSIHMTGAGLVSNCVFTGNSTVNDGGAVHMTASGLIANCVITNNSANRWGGGVEFEGSSGTIRNCLIAGNRSVQQGGGISSFNSTPLIESCTVVSNSAGSGSSSYPPLGGGGLYIYNGAGLRMTNTVLYFNTAPSGYNIAGVGAGGIGFSCAPELTAGLNGNITTDPNFMDIPGWDWRLRPGSPCMDAGTNRLSWMTGAMDVAGGARIVGGVVDIGCYEVNATNLPFLCDFRTTVLAANPLQMVFTPFVSGADTNITWYGWAFTNSASYDLTGTGLPAVTNLYADYGLYTARLAVSNASGNATSVVKTIRLYATNGVAYVSTNGLSQWPYDTWAKAATNIQYAINVAPGLLVLVTNGTYNVTAELIPNNGTLRSVNGATNTIIRRLSGTTRIFNIGVSPDGIPITNAVVDGFTIRDGNIGAGNGGGIAMSAGTVQNCIVANNTAGTYGGGIEFSGGMVSNCVVANNACASYDGGGVHVSISWSGGLVINCVITNNTTARWGAGVEFDSSSGTSFGTLRNCLIVGNKTTLNSAGYGGGGVSSYNGNGRIENCTIVSNSAATLGGGILQSSGTLTMTNTIVYSNSASSGFNLSGTITAGYCCAPELTAGLNGNITETPLFKDFANRDFHLAPGSLCIDSGTNIVAVVNDLDGNPRPFDGNGDTIAIDDMGAYESTSSVPYIVAVSTTPTSPVGTNSLQVIFTSQVFGPNTNIAWYGWDFYNDGSYDLTGANLQTVTNFYATPGLYSINVAVSNTSGSVTNTVKPYLVRVYSSTGIAYVSTNGLEQWPYDTWAKAATNIQSAIDLAPNTTVLVSNGTYSLTSMLTLNNGTVLRGLNGASNTIIRRASGTIQLCSLNLYVGVPITNATLDGFTIREGNSGVMTLNAGTVQNCIIASNTGGSAISMSGGALKNCSVLNNSGGTYGAVNITGGSGSLISNCVIAGNATAYDGGGVHVSQYYSALIANCIITNNTANRWGGGVEFDNASGRIQNCLIARNRAVSQGGGVSVWNGTATIESSTIVSNSAFSVDIGYAPPGGGGLYVYGASNARTTNCIVYFNTSPTNANIAGPANAAYSCAPELTNGVNGNLSSDPMFRNPGSGDYHLSRSPCMNSGTNMAWMTGALDLDGVPRIVNGNVDMGAYEVPYPNGSVYTLR